MESEQSILSIEYIIENSYLLVKMGPVANTDLMMSPMQRSARQTKTKIIWL